MKPKTLILIAGAAAIAYYVYTNRGTLLATTPKVPSVGAVQQN